MSVVANVEVTREVVIGVKSRVLLLMLLLL